MPEANYRRLPMEKKELVRKIFLKVFRLGKFSDISPEILKEVIASAIVEHSFFKCNASEDIIAILNQEENGVDENSHAQRMDSPLLPEVMEEVEKYLEEGGRFSEHPTKLAARVMEKIGSDRFTHGLLTVASARVISGWKKKKEGTISS